MEFSRRDFIKTAGVDVGCGCVAVWAYDAQAATAAVFRCQQGRARRCRACDREEAWGELRRHSHQPLSAGERLDTRAAGAERVERAEFRLWRARADKRHVGLCRKPDRDADEVVRVTTEAAAIAKANSAITRKKIELVPTPKVVANVEKLVRTRSVRRAGRRKDGDAAEDQRGGARREGRQLCQLAARRPSTSRNISRRATVRGSSNTSSARIRALRRRRQTVRPAIFNRSIPFARRSRSALNT